MNTEMSIFDRPAEVPEDLLKLAAEKGWPEDLIRRGLELRLHRRAMEWWMTTERQMTPELARRFLDTREQLLNGTMRVREATWTDSEALADLYASSPEEIGDWEITVERGPYAFAQFRLQEHVSVTIVEDKGIILAATADSSRNTVVGGQRTTAHIASAWRVRKECRGQGLSHWLRLIGGPGCGWFGWYNYYYVRPQNFAALGWIKTFLKDAVEGLAEVEGDVPGMRVSVLHFAPRPLRRDRTGIRHVTEADLPQCLRLINRTHKGRDLFRPYSREFLEERLNDPCWGEKPPFWEPVYGWPDYYVVEEEGRVVACGGLWDKGAHGREAWRHKETGETKTIDCTALLDFGYAAGREEAMARLIGFFIGKTHALGRSHLAAGVEHLPRLVKALAQLEPTTETRALHWQRYDPVADQWVADALQRPYTDLAYW
ncbi:MAG: hypothetical protein Q7T33_11685 [Dehalococcoidia bacterium]|nr:hypothetical protein [Dehalococcoidia bacterium]